MIVEFRWLRHGRPVPDGWTVSPDQMFGSHHHRYCVLIERPA